MFGFAKIGVERNWGVCVLVYLYIGVLGSWYVEILDHYVEKMDKSLETLEIYQMALSLSRISWEIYAAFDYMTKKAIWLQYIRSMDSIWANISEWYWRFHYLDSAKFYYNSRWSLFETKYRLRLMYDRKLVSEDAYKNIDSELNILWKKLNNFISAVKNKLKESATQ